MALQQPPRIFPGPWWDSHPALGRGLSPAGFRPSALAHAQWRPEAAQPRRDPDPGASVRLPPSSFPLPRARTSNSSAVVAMPGAELSPLASRARALGSGAARPSGHEAGDARQLPAGAARAAPMAAAAHAGSGQRACAPRPGAVGKGGGGRARSRLGQSRPGSRLGGAGKAGPRGPPSRKRAVGAEVGRSGRKQRLHSS